MPPNEEDERLSKLNDRETKMDDRARVVKEILESERKYVQDLEVLQVCLALPDLFFSSFMLLTSSRILPVDQFFSIPRTINELFFSGRSCLQIRSVLSS